MEDIYNNKLEKINKKIEDVLFNLEVEDRLIVLNKLAKYINGEIKKWKDYKS